MPQIDHTGGPCPDEAELADYMAGGLREPQLGILEEHLASCPTCLDHLAAAGRAMAAGAQGAAEGPQAVAEDATAAAEGARGAPAGAIAAATLQDLAAAREGVKRGLAGGRAGLGGADSGVELPQGGMRGRPAPRCANCGLVNIPGSVYCRSCGRVIPYEGLRCHSCRRILPTDSKYCYHCGAPLLGLPPVESWNRAARWLLRNRWLVGAGMCIVVAWGVEKFWEFLILALIFGLKWAVDLSYAKTLITIYQSVQRGDEKERNEDLSRTLDRLRRP